ncbi:hypothetical protein D3C72_2217800 [compost metagenome]
MPIPANRSAVHPATPKTVINILFFDLNKFLVVILSIKFNLFHINLILSTKTFLPFLGGLGLRRDAGTSFNSLLHEDIVIIIIVINVTIIDIKTILGLVIISKSGA